MIGEPVPHGEMLRQGSTGPSSASATQNFALKQRETDGNNSASVNLRSTFPYLPPTTRPHTPTLGIRDRSDLYVTDPCSLPRRYSCAPLGNGMRACVRLLRQMAAGGIRVACATCSIRDAALRSPPRSHHQLALAHGSLAVIVKEIVLLLFVEVRVLVRLVVGAAAVVIGDALAASRVRRRPSLSRRLEYVNVLEVGRRDAVKVLTDRHL